MNEGIKGGTRRSWRERERQREREKEKQADRQRHFRGTHERLDEALRQKRAFQNRSVIFCIRTKNAT